LTCGHRTQSSFKEFHVSPLWPALLADHIICAVMAQPRARSATRFVSVASQFSLSTQDTRNALGSWNPSFATFGTLFFTFVFFRTSCSFVRALSSLRQIVKVIATRGFRRRRWHVVSYHEALGNYSRGGR